MKGLLDSHTFLWFIDDSKPLSDRARGFIENSDNTIYLSIASLWEIAIKSSLGKLVLAKPIATLVSDQSIMRGIVLLEITLAHVTTVHSLPFHHRDPFDRMLIAQAKVERIPIISRDEAFDAYGVKRLW